MKDYKPTSKERIDDNDNVLSMFNTDILVKVISGEYDLNYLARVEMANRGFDENGNWIGFNQSKKLFGIE